MARSRISICVRGRSPSAKISIVLKDNNSNTTSTYLHITNDAVVVSRGPVNLGHKTGNARVGKSTGILDLSCSARLDVTNDFSLGAGVFESTYTNIYNTGCFEIRDQASSYVEKTVYIGHTQCSTGRVTVLNQGDFTTGGGIHFGSSSNAVGYLEAKDDATIVCGGVFYMANGKQAKAYAALRDRATLSVSPSVGNWMCLAPQTEDASARFEAADDAVVTFSGASSLEMTMGGTSRAEFILSGRAKLLGGSNSYVTNKSAIVGNTSVSLSGQALMSMCAVYGGSPAEGSPTMTFAADGGTLTIPDSSVPRVPYMSGCVATLGAGGFTLDTKDCAVEIDQDFRAAEGASSATFTKTGVGTLTVRRNSSHPRTVVSEGVLTFAAGATRFGAELEVAPGAGLAVADAASMIAADRLLFSDTLVIDLPTDYSLNEAHPVLSVATPLTDGQLAKIVVRNPEFGKSYRFALDAARTSVSVTVTETGSEGYTWNAVSGSWNEPENWSPVGVPSHNDAVTVAAGAAITMDAAGSAGTLAVQMMNPVTVSGEAALYVAEGVSVVGGGSLTVSAPLRSVNGLAKDGMGTVTLSGANRETMTGDWILNGGVTEFATSASLGADSVSASALTISNCTFRYAGTATEMTRPLRIAGEYCSVLDIAGDLTLKRAEVSYADTKGGGIVKTGAGTLTFEFPHGVTSLSVRGADGRGTNADVSGSFSPVNGEVRDWAGVGQFSVLDGKVVVQGQGRDVTTIKQEHHCSVGGSNWKSTVAPELCLKDVTYHVGSGNGFHMLMDTQVAKGAPPAKLIMENARLVANGLYIGWNRGSGNDEVVKTVMALTNSTVDVTWNFEAPHNSAGLSPMIRIGRGGLLRRDSSTPAGGVFFHRVLDVRVEDGGCIEVKKPQNLYLGAAASGDLILANGGGIKVHRLLAQSRSGPTAVAFDNGYAQFTLNEGISAAVNPAGTSLRADAGGGELRVDAGVSHALAIPLQGTGAFTKTGAGTLVVTNDTNFSMADNLPGYTPLTSQHVKIENAGGVRIAEGTLRCVAGTTGAASRFSGTGTLSGAFDVLRLDVAADAADGLTLADLTATKVVVDFGRTAADPVAAGDVAVVAKLGADVAFGDLVWRGINLGDGKVADFACSADGVVTATFRSTGMTIFIR